MLDKLVCALSDIEPNTEYHHICEHVLDYCFSNVACGKHGHCASTLTGFKCSCSFLYGGIFCDTWSKEGIQIMIGVGFIIILYIMSWISTKQFIKSQEQLITFTVNRRDLVRDILVGLLSIFILSVIFTVITSRYYTLFKINSINGEKLAISINATIRSVQTCHFILDHRRENLSFFPAALVLIFIFSCCIKRQKTCLNTCYSRP
ncbi:unnamed protein product, partial [Rotaria magnacalcarata]